MRTPEVVVQPDGIHVHVISRLDEPAEMVGVFGQDVEAGETTYVSLVAPGSIGVACNPFSQHGDDRGPDTLSLKVHDPAALYVEGELECDGGTWGGVSDFAGVPADAGTGSAHDRSSGDQRTSSRR